MILGIERMLDDVIIKPKLRNTFKKSSVLRKYGMKSILLQNLISNRLNAPRRIILKNVTINHLYNTYGVFSTSHYKASNHFK